MRSITHWISIPENQSARSAANHVVESLIGRGANPTFHLLYLYGPPGVGKTHLISTLVQQATLSLPDLVVSILDEGRAGAFDFSMVEGDADLVILENLQRWTNDLAAHSAESIVQLIDRCQSRRQQLVITASLAPAEMIYLPARLLSRLVSGLVIELPSWSPASRLDFLRQRCQQLAIQIPEDILLWLSSQLPGSGRQLDGALQQIRRAGGVSPLILSHIKTLFAIETDQSQPTLQRITQRVCDYFQVKPKDVQSTRRLRDYLLPRQVGMYLARKLTHLSLDEIGSYFGGRDHSTVLHACRKVEEDLHADSSLSNAVRRLQADLA